MQAGGTQVIDFHAMGGPCRLRLAGLTAADAQRAAQAAIDEVRRIEAKYSRYRADSVVSRINGAAGTGVAIEVDNETADLLRFADELHAASDGLFDLTSGVLRRAWDFKSARLPSQAELDRLLPLIGWQRVAWSGQALALPDAGMEIDFGGIGKEYACDRAAAVLVAHGVSHGIVNLGGDLRVVGPQADGSPWRIGITHPRRDGEAVAGIDIAEGALATSGDYERCFITPDGRRCCHILDPRTGWPVDHWQGVSVLAPACLAAGALATIAMLRQGAALPFLRDEGVAFLAVDAQGRLLRHDDDFPS